MKAENISILKVNVTNKRIVMNYHDHRDDLNYEVEKEEPAHPDLGDAMGLLDSDIADALHAKKDAIKNYKTKEWVIDEADSKKTLTIKASMSNKWDYANTVSSGKIPFESETLVEKVDKIREELFAYFFEGKQAQGTFPGMQARGLASQESGEEKGGDK